MKKCQYCKHFFQTAMAMNMGDGNSGYCLLIQNDDSIGVLRNKYGIRQAKPSAFRRKNNTCDKFENGANNSKKD